MDPEIEVLPDIPTDLAAVDVMANGSWVGVGGSPEAREILFGGHVVRTLIECRFPLVCALDPGTAVLVDARAPAHRPNAWVVRIDGAQTAEFAVGDAVQSLASVRGSLVVTHFDEGFGNDLHGMLVFDRAGQLQLHYARDIAGACGIVDCYAVGPSGGNRILLLIYPDFPLAEVDVAARTQDVWPTPDVVHGAAAVSALGRTVYFHGSYTDRTAVHAWRRGDKDANRIASFQAPLRGLRGGWFLGSDNGQYVRVRFGTPDAAT
jgi:hypothetical protein